MEPIETLFQLPSPIQFLKTGIFEGMHFAVKRDDLIHPLISGNKWRKLQGIIATYNESLYASITTFGGAFSNHLVATAATCAYLDIHCQAYVRTDKIDLKNPTLKICAELGMNLLPLDRNTYSKKHEPETLEHLKSLLQESLFIPEGGSSACAIQGVQECISEISHTEIKFDTYITALGTGATSAGLLSKIDSSKNLLIFPAIKGFTNESFNLVYQELVGHKTPTNYSIHYHPSSKAYAKKDLSLFQFIEEFFVDHGILLDPIYSGKAMFAFLDSGIMNAQKKFCFIHTGGIQAWNGYFYRFPTLNQTLPNIFREVQSQSKSIQQLFDH